MKLEQGVKGGAAGFELHFDIPESAAVPPSETVVKRFGFLLVFELFDWLGANVAELQSQLVICVTVLLLLLL